MNLCANNQAIADLSYITDELTASGFKNVGGVFCCGKDADVSIAVDVGSYSDARSAVRLLKRLSKLKRCKIYAVTDDSEITVNAKKSFLLLRGGKENGVCRGRVLVGEATYGFSVKNGDCRQIDYAEKIISVLRQNRYYYVCRSGCNIVHRFFSAEEAERFALDLAAASNAVDDKFRLFAMISVKKFAAPFVTTLFSGEFFRSLGLNDVISDIGAPCFITANAMEKCLLTTTEDETVVDIVKKYVEAVNG